MLLFRPARRRGPSPDRGFTLVEVLLSILIAGTMSAIAVTGWRGWTNSTGQRGTADEIVATMRLAQQQAIAEGRSYCVKFDTDDNSYGMVRGLCTSGTEVVNSPIPTQGNSELVGAIFIATDGTPMTGAQFTPRGSASPGAVVIQREDSDEWFVVKVEALTGRAEFSKVASGSCNPGAPGNGVPAC